MWVGDWFNRRDRHIEGIFESEDIFSSRLFPFHTFNTVVLILQISWVRNRPSSPSADHQKMTTVHLIR